MLGAKLYVPYLVLVFHLAASRYTVSASGLISDSFSRSDALDRFFDSIDQDGDGQIQAAEASQYIDENFDEHELAINPSKAAQQMRSKLDGNDADATVSKEEVEKHLKRLLKASSNDRTHRPHNLTTNWLFFHTKLKIACKLAVYLCLKMIFYLQGNRLADWLRNSAQMPQYVQSFKDNAVTVSILRHCSLSLVAMCMHLGMETFKPAMQFSQNETLHTLHQELQATLS